MCEDRKMLKAEAAADLEGDNMYIAPESRIRGADART